MQLVEQFPEKPIDYDMACQILGTYCEATVKKHYELITKMMQIATNLLMTWVAIHPLLSTIPTTTPAVSVLSLFMDTYKALISSQEKLTGYSNDSPEVILFPAYVLMIKKVRMVLSIPLNFNYLIRFLFDTS